jgi:hypothetical protein
MPLAQPVNVSMARQAAKVTSLFIVSPFELSVKSFGLQSFVGSA